MDEKTVSLMCPLKNSTVICHKRLKPKLVFDIMSSKMCGSMDLICEHKEVGIYKDALFTVFVKKKLLNFSFFILYFIKVLYFEYAMLNVKQNKHY